MDIYNKPSNSKRHMSFISNHPRNCLINIQFCLARRTCTIFEEENTKLRRLSELKTLKQQQLKQGKEQQFCLICTKLVQYCGKFENKFIRYLENMKLVLFPLFFSRVEFLNLSMFMHSKESNGISTAF